MECLFIYDIYCYADKSVVSSSYCLLSCNYCYNCKPVFFQVLRHRLDCLVSMHNSLYAIYGKLNSKYSISYLVAVHCDALQGCHIKKLKSSSTSLIDYSGFSVVVNSTRQTDTQCHAYQLPGQNQFQIKDVTLL